jgi:hypothetical protein
MQPFSPKTVNLYVEELLAKLNAEIEPELLTIHPESYSKEANCFVNVNKKIELDGGSVCYGWAVLQSSIICEAERHSVWVSPDDELVDITPRPHGITEILFIPDENFVYMGQLEDNVRINITTNSVVDDFILICEYLEKVEATGERKNEDEIQLPSSQAAHLRNVLLRLKQNTYYFIIKMKGNINTKCWCNSNKSYKNCHKMNLKEDLQEMFNDVFKIKS